MKFVFISLAVCVVPILLRELMYESGEGGVGEQCCPVTDSQHSSLLWSRSQIVHMVLSMYFLFDIVIEFSITRRYEFILGNALFFLQQSITAIIAYARSDKCCSLSYIFIVDQIITLWILNAFLDKTTAHLPAGSTINMLYYFRLPFTAVVFVEALAVLVSANFVDFLFIGLLVIAAASTLMGAFSIIGQLELRVERKKQLTVENRRSMVLVMCIVIFIASLVVSVFYSSSFGQIAFPDRDGIAVYTGMQTIIIICLSLLPRRIGLDFYVQEKHHLDSKLAFMTKISHSITDRAFPFIAVAKQISQYSGKFPQLQLQDFIVSSDLCDSILKHFTLCESYLNGDVRADTEACMLVVVRNALDSFKKKLPPTFELKLNGCEDDFYSNVLLNGKKISEGEYSFEKFEQVFNMLLGIAADAPERSGVLEYLPRRAVISVSVSITKDEDVNSTFNPLNYLQSLCFPAGNFFFTLRIQGPGLTSERFKLFNEINEQSHLLPVNKERNSGLEFLVCHYFTRAHNGTIEIIDLPPRDNNTVLDEDKLVAVQLKLPINMNSKSVVSRASLLRNLEALSSKTNQPENPGIIRCLCNMICGFIVRAGPDVLIDRIHISDSTDSSGVNVIELSSVGDAAARESIVVLPETAKPAALVQKSEEVPPVQPAERPVKSRLESARPSGLTIPAATVDFDSKTPSRSPKSPSFGVGPLRHARNLKILIVDDSPLTRKILRRWLKQLAVGTIEEASDGVEAVQLVSTSLEQGEPFHVVLLDYVMPTLTGPLAVEQMRAMGFQGLVLGVTALSDTDAMQTFIAHGADRVLCKPLTIEQIVKVISGLTSELGSFT